MRNKNKKKKRKEDKSKSKPKSNKTKPKPKLNTKIVTKAIHGNKDQKKEIEKKNEGHTFYAVSQKNKWNQYNPIALLDQEGHFRGTAIFESKQEATEYLERYNQIMVDKGRTVNLKVIEQHRLPPANRPAYIISSQQQQPQTQQPQQEEQNKNNNTDTTFLED